MRQTIKTGWIWGQGVWEFLTPFSAAFLLTLKSFPNKNSNKKVALGSQTTPPIKTCISLFTYLNTSPSNPTISQAPPRWHVKAHVDSGLWRQHMTPQSLSNPWLCWREKGRSSSPLHCPLPDYLSPPLLGQALSWGPSLGDLYLQAWLGPQAAGALSPNQGMPWHVREEPTEDICELTNHVNLGGCWPLRPWLSPAVESSPLTRRSPVSPSSMWPRVCTSRTR